MSNNQSSLLNSQIGNQMNGQIGIGQQLNNNQMNISNPQMYPPNAIQQYGRNPAQNLQQIHQQQTYANPFLNQTYQYQQAYQLPQQPTLYPNQMVYGTNGIQNGNIQQQSIQQSDDQEIKWVQGEAGAKAYLLAPNKRVMLMDSEADTFYIKSTDINGVPLPLRIYDFHERGQMQLQNDRSVDDESTATTSTASGRATQMGDVDSTSNYITREEFEKAITDPKTAASTSAFNVNNYDNNGNNDDINNEPYNNRRNNNESFVQSSGRQQNAKSTKQHAKHNSTV